ncbi:MAG: hypothetical protein BWX77_00953 [Bacteroidetes bacterium ADurb.Bin090]|nr:MAG: hypothetical protein BWX77_00953 [Bacteroidetes bacterium ADurb.Bin090]
MYHRGQVKTQGFAAQAKAITLFYLDDSLVCSVIAFEHLCGLGITQDLNAGISLTYGIYRRRMIGLHMIDDQIIQRTITHRPDYHFEQFRSITGFNRIDKSYFFSNNQIGVVRNTQRQRPEIFKKMSFAVVHAYVVNKAVYFKFFGH